MKNYTLILCYLLFSVTYTGCSQNKKAELKTETLSQLLTSIDQNQDIESLGKALDENVIIYIPDAPPIYSREVVIDLFSYLWNKTKNTNISYNPNSIEKIDDEVIEKGLYSYVDEKGIKTNMPYSIKSNKNLIAEVVYDNSKKTIIELPRPTGTYNIGQSVHFFEDYNNTSRPLAFQIWYPTLENSKNKISFQSKSEAEAISNFLGWPSFNNSFTRLIKSNSIKDVPIAPNKKFPIVIYNHGYGGATSVYQTIFEELASHGYIVVSVGHQDESAFLLKEDGAVMQNSPQSKFYQKRAPELNNRTIGVEQSTILNSNDLEKLTKAYKRLVKLSPLHTESVNLWVLDTENVIKKLKELNDDNKYLKRGFDFNNMGVFGHSVGGATAGEFGSKNIFKAGINIDGFQFGNLINSNLEIPFLFISSNEEGDRYLRVDPFANTSGNEVYHAIIKGFSHGSFSDLQLFSSEEKGLKDIQLQRKLILTYFDRYLKHETINIQALSSEFESLTINKLND